MIGQQRQILTELGIDLWIPRDAACQNLDLDSIWRDERPDNTALELHAHPVPVVTAKTVVTDQIVATPNSTPIQQQPVQEIIAAPIAHVVQATNLHKNIKKFELQLLSLPQYVVVIDSSDLSVEAQQLWANIHAALQAEYQQLNWPFPLLNLQDPQGAYSYMQGFLAVHGLDKQLLVLGELPCMPQQSRKLPSLDDMLAQPILKKQLWNALNNK
ncbi:hypothetical protein [uncultured Acinetobacter sp.]|uniref:hypothetical protein n=1 Tax=uncultured Acinetobacter sp. TaxID=165433 RepID=UPI00262E4691|nr:hypothetical protein [uncultured Acinetobacter sp.]